MRIRRRLRFSLLGLVGTVTILVLGIGLYRASQDVMPLRDLVDRFRTEFGYFPVDDETRIHVRRIPVKIPTAFQWRVYLPSTRTFTLHYYLGPAPDPAIVGKEIWLGMLRQQSRPVGKGLETGEFSYEALLTEYGDKSWLIAGTLADRGSSFELPTGYEWLTDSTTWVVSSDASYESLRLFDAKTPVILLHIERRIHVDDPADEESATSAAAAGERFVLWIDSN